MEQLSPVLVATGRGIYCPFLILYVGQTNWSPIPLSYKWQPLPPPASHIT